jgi:hypothetical protein
MITQLSHIDSKQKSIYESPQTGTFTYNLLPHTLYKGACFMEIEKYIESAIKVY